MTPRKFGVLALQVFIYFVFSYAFLACLVVVYATASCFPPTEMDGVTKISYAISVMGGEDRMEESGLMDIITTCEAFVVLTGYILQLFGVLYVVFFLGKQVYTRICVA